MLSLVRYIKLSNIKSTLRYIAIAATVLISFVVFIFAMVQGETYEYQKDKTTIVATSFAPYDFAKQIAGESAEVIMLLAPGEESHTYEPTPGDIMKIQQCDLFVYGGGESEKWVDSILESIGGGVKTVKMMDVVELHQENHDHEAHDNHSHEEKSEYDEHVWTSPVNAMKIVEAISSALQQTDSANAEIYAENTENYLSLLGELDNRFETMIASSEKDTIIIGDRFPLMYFTERYTLDYDSAFPGCSAQTEANPATIARLIDNVKQNNINVVFKVDLSKGSVAYTISEATDAVVETLYSCHVISAEDFANGETYITLMNRNYEALKSALN